MTENSTVAHVLDYDAASGETPICIDDCPDCEREQAHATGKHAFCGPDCDTPDEALIQALSDAGAMCGDCGDEPGDRKCAACEDCRQEYVKATRKAGWVPQSEVDRLHAEARKATADRRWHHERRVELAAEVEQLRTRVAELERRPDRATVLREAQDATVAWLHKKARGRRAKGPQYARQADLIDVLASKAARGAIREFLEAAKAEPVDPWQTATDGLNALSGALWHLTPDCAISNLKGPERIEYDRDTERWRLVHDDADGGETP